MMAAGLRQTLQRRGTIGMDLDDRVEAAHLKYLTHVFP